MVETNDTSPRSERAERFRRLHQPDLVTVELFAAANPEAVPVPFTVSGRHARDVQENKLFLAVRNDSVDRLVLGGPAPGCGSPLMSPRDGGSSGIYLNFSDLMDIDAMHAIQVTTAAGPVLATLQWPMLTLRTPDGEPVATSTPMLGRPGANPRHLGDEIVMHVWPEQEIAIEPGEALVIELENASSDFRPAIRYLDVSWDLRRVRFDDRGAHVERVEGFHQFPVTLVRPPDWVEPPFPLVAHWLDGRNTIYTGEEPEVPSNALKFAISNVGLHPLELDVRKHSRGVPYFELVMVAAQDDDRGELSHAVAHARDLALAQIEDRTGGSDRDNPFAQLWRVNKKVQGPVVKWEFRPDLDWDSENYAARLRPSGPRASERINLIGVDADATLEFRLHDLRSRLPAGVALVYFRYYNMPDHDDGQLVLFLEKRALREGRDVLEGLDVQRFAPELNSPLRWKVSGEGAARRTLVSLADHVGIGTAEPKHPLEVAGGVVFGSSLNVAGDVSFQRSVKIARSVSAQEVVAANRKGPPFEAIQINGEWQTLIENFKGPRGYEVMVYAHKDDHVKAQCHYHALAHVIALSCYPGDASQTGLTITQAIHRGSEPLEFQWYLDGNWDKLQLRVRADAMYKGGTITGWIGRLY